MSTDDAKAAVTRFLRAFERGDLRALEGLRTPDMARAPADGTGVALCAASGLQNGQCARRQVDQTVEERNRHLRSRTRRQRQPGLPHQSVRSPEKAAADL
jgi:ketosteroid isomerase-like protein